MATIIFFFIITLDTGPRRFFSLELSETNIYEPYMRARLVDYGAEIIPAKKTDCRTTRSHCFTVLVLPGHCEREYNGGHGGFDL